MVTKKISKSKAEKYQEACEDIGAEEMAELFAAVKGGGKVTLKETWVTIETSRNKSSKPKTVEKIEIHGPKEYYAYRIMAFNATERNSEVVHEGRIKSCNKKRFREHMEPAIAKDSKYKLQVRLTNPTDAEDITGNLRLKTCHGTPYKFFPSKIEG